MIVSNIRDIDIKELRKIHKTDFPFPDFSNYLSAKTIIDNGKLIGAGMVRATSEGILVIDESQPLATRVRALKKIISDLSLEARFMGIKDCHVFTKEEKMHDALLKLDFQDCIGRCMVKHL